MTKPPHLVANAQRYAAELESVNVPINTTLEQSLHLRARLIACTCLGCYELADFITDEISRALLAVESSSATLSAALASAEQAVERDRVAIRHGLATHYFIRGMMKHADAPRKFDRIARLAVEIITTLDDTGGPLAVFEQRIEELAASHRAVLDVDQP